MVWEKFFGISRERHLPPFARQPFTTWFKRRGKPAGDNRPQVVLFNDTFNTYNYPHISIAATELLEAAGYEVILPGHGCCGRPALSKGLVAQARAQARATVEKLAPLAEAGLPIIGLEPSCILTLGDEYRDLLPDDKRLGAIANQAVMLETFIARETEAGRLSLPLTDAKREVLLHGHCHQKALVGTADSQRMLTLPANYTVSEVDSGCCGMAGSFGYEVEHVEVSKAMAERRLLPAVRETSAETLIAAAGVSCREQVHFGTGRRAQHPAEILRDALVSD